MCITKWLFFNLILCVYLIKMATSEEIQPKTTELVEQGKFLQKSHILALNFFPKFCNRSHISSSCCKKINGNFTSNFL